MFCLISGLMWCTERYYETYRELPSGKVVADLVLVPRNRPDLPVLIVEFKRDPSAEEALSQIREKNYAGRYLKPGMENDVLLIGLSYRCDTRIISASLRKSCPDYMMLSRKKR